MPTQPFNVIQNMISHEDLVNEVAKLQKLVRYLLNGQIDFENIRARAIKAENIEADAITANEIAANAITANELAAAIADREPRGEYTLVVAPPAGAVPDEPGDDARTDALVRALLAQGVTTKTVAAALAELPGISRKEAYARVLALGDDA